MSGHEGAKKSKNNVIIIVEANNKNFKSCRKLNVKKQ